MKVLHVAVFTPTSTNVWQANGFEELGHEIIRYDYRQKVRDLGGLEQRDADIIGLCSKEAPDIILFSKCNKMGINVVKECGKIGKTVLWYMDNKWNLDNEVREKMTVCNYVFCSRWDGLNEAFKLNNKVYRLQGGYNSNVHYPMAVSKTRNSCFIGMVRSDRKVYIKTINADVVNGVYNKDHSKIVSETKINLNFTEEDGTSNRLYKLLAAGGFVLTTPWYRMEKDFTIGKDFDVFSTPEELQKKVVYYLEHEDEREKIAVHGCKTVKQYDHINYANRIMETVA